MAKAQVFKFDEPSVSDVHVDAPLGGKKSKKELTPAFLKHLHSQLKEAKSDLTLDDLKGMVARSRSHAGGKMKAANRLSASQASEGTSYTKLIESINAQLREEFSSPLYGMGCYPWAREVYDDHVIVSDDNGGFYSIPYTVAEGGDIEFGEVVEVEQEFVPKAASEGNNVLDLCAQNHGYVLFNKFSFADPPATMPLMPKPGTYTHKEYGKVKITKERNQTFADNLNNKIYQEHIPIDLEHQLQTSGAVGYITAAEVNADGSVDGVVEWNERGVDAIEGDKFKYVSPMWFDKWTDPMSEKEYSDVVIGAALTTRPFFKDKALRPLIATESGLMFGDTPKVTEKEIVLNFTALAPIHEGESMTKAQIEAARALVKAADAKKAGETLEGKTDEDIKTARALVATEDKRIADEAKKATEKTDAEPPKEFADRLAAAETQAKEFKEKLDKAEAEAKKANERAAEIEKQNRAMKFTETSKAWPGEKADNVKMLEHLFSASEDGEDGELFKAHVKTMNAAAAQSSIMFNELGSAGGGETGAITGEVEAAIAKQMSEKTGTTREQAFTAVWEMLPPTKREGYRQEQRSVN